MIVCLCVTCLDLFLLFSLLPLVEFVFATKRLMYPTIGVVVVIVVPTHCLQQASDAVRELPKLQASYSLLEARYAAAVELVGERDEQLEELANDLEDVKQLYRQQIETLLAQQMETASAVE